METFSACCFLNSFFRDVDDCWKSHGISVQMFDIFIVSLNAGQRLLLLLHIKANAPHVSSFHEVQISLINTVSNIEEIAETIAILQ